MLFLQTPCRVSRDFDIVIGETRTVLEVSWKRSIGTHEIANELLENVKQGVFTWIFSTVVHDVMKVAVNNFCNHILEETIVDVYFILGKER